MSDRRFEIDPDIAKASTPPNWVYTDRAVFEASRERIFAKSWQLVGDIEQVRVPGQVYPCTFLEGLLDEPLLLVRDRDDKLRCISNVCTHRGMLVCEHPGVESSLRCRYHGRKFDLNGKFTYMPEFEGTANFPSPKDDLRQVSLAQWGPFVFASLDPETSFDEWFMPLPERLNWLPIKAARFDAARSRDYLVNCNWILYCENYLEGFHIPFVHAGLADGLDFGSYRTELFEHGNVQVGIARGGEPAIVPPPDSIDHGQQVAGYFFWLFPNLMFNVYPWGISVNIVRPVAVDRTRVSFLSYVWDGSKLDTGVGGQLDRVEREDESIVEAVQRGLHSHIYERGRYSPTREQGTHHLHRMLAQRLAVT
ncbi:MAG: aromatic ring-hydroxylating dioxygenase subunit alpha [Planctomycetes bacterium]|nr:aromatic ring-hydroxylating dioxygenase subunit alpha [Planctomycetota bacterium]MBI3834837.1 aromatic ring-hydroxylating dioxygenase subunit alpha [Planctomycetota bacterium]